MIYELRIYRCLPGGMPPLLKRFETVTVPVWERFGIKTIGFWTVAVGEASTDLYYMIEWQSMAEREQKWPEWQKDPDWIAAGTPSGPPWVQSTRNMFLNPTSFSALR